MTVSPVPVPWLISAVWVSLVLLTFTILGATSTGSWVMMGAVSLVPCAVLLRLWTDGPPQTIAEVIRAAEDRR